MRKFRSHYDTPSELLACWYAYKSGLSWFEACQLTGFSNSHFKAEYLEDYLKGVNPTRDTIKEFLKEKYSRIKESGELYNIEEKPEISLKEAINVVKSAGYKVFEVEYKEVK